MPSSHPCTLFLPLIEPARMQRNRSSSRSRASRSSAASEEPELQVLSRSGRSRTRAAADSKASESPARSSRGRSRSQSRGRGEASAKNKSAASPARAAATATNKKSSAKAASPATSSRSNSRARSTSRSRAAPVYVDLDSDQEDEILDADIRIVRAPRAPPPTPKSEARSRPAADASSSPFTSSYRGGIITVTDPKGNVTSTTTTTSHSSTTSSYSHSTTTTTSLSGRDASAGTSKRDSSNAIHIALVVAFYFATSLAVVFLNKTLLSDPALKSFSVTITWIQIVGAVIFALLSSPLSASVAQSAPALAPIFPRLKVSFPLILQTLPSAIFFALTLAFSNKCLQEVPVSFYQVARAWTIICNITLAYIVTRVKPSCREAICCAVIVGGYVLACAGEQNLTGAAVLAEVKAQAAACFAPFAQGSLRAIQPWDVLKTCTSLNPNFAGLFYGFLSSMCLATYSLLVRRDLNRLPLSNQQLATVLNISAAVIYFVYLVASGELKAAIVAKIWTIKGICFSLFAVTVAGYLVNFATFLQIETTSALTHNVSGTAKASLQSVIGWVLHRNPVTQITLIGTIVNVLGCAAYAWVRQFESAATAGASRGQAKKPSEDVDYPCWAKKIQQFAHRFTTKPPKSK